MLKRARDPSRARPLRRAPAAAGWSALFGVLLAIPFVSFFSDPWLQVFFFVGLYVILGMGLNVVVGFAGLLDLGYVAFVAAGAYTVAILGSPVSAADVQFSFWLALPLAIFVGGILGILLGLPVLPLRGDYLAIVTLGFGEIIRIFLVNRDDLTEGSQGISAIPKPEVPVIGSIDDFTNWYYFVVVLAILAGFVTSRLQSSGVGRAWEAIREDEDVAAGMGINTTRYKLMAFAIGAAIGGLGGAIYAAHTGFVNPAAFSLQVSIDVLALVIIGGMGSTAGIVVGSFTLIGVPRILLLNETGEFLGKLNWFRDALNRGIDAINAASPWDLGTLPPADEWGAELADDTRFIIFGALLIAIMILRPSGLFPSRRRQLEFEAAEQAAATTGTT